MKQLHSVVGKINNYFASQYWMLLSDHRPTETNGRKREINNFFDRRILFNSVNMNI